MTLNQIVFRIASVYPAILEYWDMTLMRPRRSTDGGCYVAKFIAAEIQASYQDDDDDDARFVAHEMQTAYHQEADDADVRIAALVTRLQHGADRLQASAHAVANMSREGQPEAQAA